MNTSDRSDRKRPRRCLVSGYDSSSLFSFSCFLSLLPTLARSCSLSNFCSHFLLLLLLLSSLSSSALPPPCHNRATNKPRFPDPRPRVMSAVSLRERPFSAAYKQRASHLPVDTPSASVLITILTNLHQLLGIRRTHASVPSQLYYHLFSSPQPVN